MNTREWEPGHLLEISGYYWKTCTLHAAIKLDVFTCIGSDQLTVEAIAERLNGNNRGVGMLLNALTAMNLLIKTDGKYANTTGSAAFLSKDSPRYIGYIILHHHHLVPSWSRLDQAVRTGRPVRTDAGHSDEEWREAFLMGMYNMAMTLAPQVVSKIDLSGRRSLLDLGGGPGTYAIHFCLENPELKATVYDLPTTRPFAQKTIEKFGLTDRIDFMDGDYLKDRIEGTYDAAWLSHILHGEGPEDCERIIRKTVSALNPGGMVIIHEFVLDNSMDGPLFPTLFSLNMLLGTDHGQAYSEKQIQDMLASAGLKQIRRVALKIPNDSGVITGVFY